MALDANYELLVHYFDEILPDSDPCDTVSPKDAFAWNAGVWVSMLPNLIDDLYGRSDLEIVSHSLSFLDDRPVISLLLRHRSASKPHRHG
ncbi:MAG: hypothetical protein ABSG90_02690 [Dehalococcoidia bacterium]|jgi:hypothetical protein